MLELNNCVVVFDPRVLPGFLKLLRVSILIYGKVLLGIDYAVGRKIEFEILVFTI